MWNRFIIIIYFLLHFPILIIPLYVWATSTTPLVVKEYRVRCTENSQYVVLQGAPLSFPYVVSDYVLLGQGRTETLEQLRFYCGYFDEAREHVRAYLETTTQAEREQANRAFHAFRDSVPTIYADNYKLEVVDKNYFHLYDFLTVVGFSTVIYYFLLQLVRVIYLYIVFNRVILHPYRVNEKSISSDSS